MKKRKELLKELPLAKVKIDDKFWNQRLLKNQEKTLNHQFQQLVKTGRLENFKKAAQSKNQDKNGDFFGMFFNDSDVYKWLEAASYVLAVKNDLELKKRMEYVIDLVTAAQEDDGYLNTYFILEAEKRWSNLGMMHELYCAGHLFEAAVANYQALGSEKLLKAAYKFADLIDQHFRQNNHPGVPGHEEIELALIKLYRVSSNSRYLKLAEYFINNRGKSYFASEVNKLKEIAGQDFKLEIENFSDFKMAPFYKKFFLAEDGSYDGSYAQDHLPLKEQNEVVGHAVRAMYLYSAAADLAAEIDDKSLFNTLEKLWQNMTKKRMYISGGIGSTHAYEGFTENYDLPNKEAYAESCAAVGSILWNHRLLKLSGESRFSNLIERTLYNGLLAGVALSGDKFFYVNPLASDGEHHRKGWFHVSCCPPNIARLLASLQKYIYLKSDSEIFINLFINSEAEIKIGEEIVKIKQSGNYPWENKIKVEIEPDNKKEFTLNIRKPDWSQKTVVYLNGKKEKVQLQAGYINITRQWQKKDKVEIKFEMKVKRIKAHSKLKENRGRFAFMRGPLLYCLEEIDNPYDLDALKIDEFYQTEVKREKILQDIMTINGTAFVENLTDWENKLYREENQIEYHKTEFKAVPYYLWDHRQPGKMRVWLRK